MSQLLPITRLQHDDFQILYEEGPCVAVCKPPGLLTQAPPQIDSLEARLKMFFKRRESKTGNIYCVPVHRLDRPVSGVVLFARNVRAARRLSSQFQNRGVRKVYWAIVEGHVAELCGEWTNTMRKVPDQPRAELVPPDHPDAQYAHLRFRVVHYWDECTLLEIEPTTGRMHQIRLQAAAHGHPIRGDEQYGARLSFGPQTDDWRARWIALHARQLTFVHPMTRQPVVVCAPFPAYWPTME